MSEIDASHTVRAYDGELRELHETIVRMGELARDQLADAVDALARGDGDLAVRVMANDAKVDESDHAVNELTVRVLALRSPVADDLRRVIGTLKAAGELERVADLAVNVAKRTLLLNSLPQMPAIGGILRMGALVGEMLKDVVRAYDTHDVGLAEQIWRRDHEVDDQCSALFRELLTYMLEDPRNITSCSHLMFIGKNIERAGDHATNIAEVVYYMVKGEPLTGERPKVDTSSFRLEH